MSSAETRLERLYLGGGSTEIVFHPARAGGEVVRLTHDGMIERARGAAATLNAAGCLQRDRPFLLFATTQAETLAAFFAGQQLGALPLAMAPPAGLGGLEAWQARVTRVARSFGASAAVGPRRFLDLLPELGLPRVNYEDLRASGPAVEDPGNENSHLQLTSGSTAASKAVLITHANIQVNLRDLAEVSELGPGDAMISWLPIFHDMGLVGAIVTPLLAHCKVALLSPQAFLVRPRRWLEVITAERGTHTPAPTFAFPYTAHRLRKTSLEGLDLASLRCTYVAAEPIHREAVRRFERLLEPVGLRPHALTTAYGMAEATIATTLPRIGQGLRSTKVSRQALAESRVAAPRDSGDALELVYLGGPVRNVEIELRDAAGKAVPAGRTGEVWIRGPNVTPGYYRDEEATRAARDEQGWLNTGDVGFLDQGELVLVGRTKDILIIHGRNYTPVDFEWAAERVAGVRPGSAAAFSVPDPREGSEVAVLACEVADELTDWERGAIAAAIRERVLARTGVRLADVVLLPPRTMPKTTSGKIQRAKVRRRYEQGVLRPEAISAGSPGL